MNRLKMRFPESSSREELIDLLRAWYDGKPVMVVVEAECPNGDNGTITFDAEVRRIGLVEGVPGYNQWHLELFDENASLGFCHIDCFYDSLKRSGIAKPRML